MCVCVCVCVCVCITESLCFMAEINTHCRSAILQFLKEGKIWTQIPSSAFTFWWSWQSHFLSLGLRFPICTMSATRLEFANSNANWGHTDKKVNQRDKHDVMGSERGWGGQKFRHKAKGAATWTSLTVQ